MDQRDIIWFAVRALMLLALVIAILLMFLPLQGRRERDHRDDH